MQNEKYIGDALLQKTYTVDFLSKKRVKNNGIVPQYYVEGSHEAIIPRDLYMQVQEEMVRRANLHSGAKRKKRVYSSKYELSSIVYCPRCGEIYRRIAWNNRGKHSIVWRCCTRVVQYKKDIADYKSKLKEAQSRPCYNPRHNKPENEPAFFKEMSDECMSRAIAILDTVFKSIESLGGSINSDLSVKIRDDIVRFRMVESQDQVKHEMTKQEAQELVKYNDDIKNHRWASKPQIRKYDKVYNGKLRIEFGERSYIRDNDSEKLEDRLGDILVTLYEKAEENRIVREAREEAERKRVEEARCREENRQRKEQEIRLVKELVNKAEDYRIAKEIREYIQAMIDSGNEDITPEWIEWALKKADWYDPSIETEDEYLGKRQHEKSAEEKEKSLQDSIRKSWYW